MILTERLYLTEDRQTVVREGDKRAAFLLGAEGTQIPDKLAQKLGLVHAAPALVSADAPEPVQHRDPVIEHRDPVIEAPKRRGRPPKNQ
jgi:hypothetical protein